MSATHQSTAQYQIRGQSTPCPDGYDRTIYYLWDNKHLSILATHTLKSVLEAKMKSLENFGKNPS